ncbi:MAG: hypothetical protein Kow0042_23050 [Calditrichia bacterium]
MNSDILTYLKPDDPAVMLFNRIGEQYAGTSLAMVGIEAEDVFDYKTLQTINSLTEQFSQIPGVASVMSLTDVLDIRSVEGGLEVGRLIDKNDIPSNPDTLQKIKAYALSKDMYNGRIVSPDGRVTIIIARLQQHADKQAIAEKIQQISRKEAGEYKLYFSGLPMQMLEITDIIVKDMLRLVPVVVLMLVLMLYFSFRTIRGVALPLVTVLIATLLAMGLMILLGIELSIVSNIMPVLLIAIGSAYGIHMIARYKEEVPNCPDKIECIKNSLAEVGVPIILAGVTTLIGFFSFAGSYLTIVTHFGIFTGIGVAFALIVSITFIPAVLAYLKQPVIKRTRSGKEAHILVHFLDKLAAFVLRREKLIVYSAGIIIVLALIGLPRLHREVNMIEYFPKDTDIRIAEDMMEKNFGGSTPIQIVVKGDLKNPFVLKQMRQLEKFMETVPYVSKPQSVADLICEMNKVMNRHYTIPDSRLGVANLWFFIESESIMEQLVNADVSEGIIQANLGTTDTRKIVQTVDRINEYLQTQMDTSLVSVRQTTVQLPLVQKYLLRKISQAILLDARKRAPESSIDTTRLKQAVQQAAEISTVNFSPENLEKLRAQLQDFFLNEAEIEIESDSRIQRIVQAVLTELQSGTVPAEDRLNGIIRRNLPPGFSADKEEIEATAHSLWVILNENFEYEKIMAGVDKVLALFPQELKSNAKFRDDVRDDLWILNDKQLALPGYLATETGLQGETVKVNFIQSGMPSIFVRLDASLLKSQIQSLFIAFILVTLILMFQLRTIWGGLMAVSPIALTVLLNFALMAYLGIPLDNATMMIASIAIGIGIDYSIHFTNRFKEEFARSNNELEALDKTLVTTGRAILINALSVAMGFIILIFAQLIPIQRFGWLTATTMIFSAAGAITFLPALILLTKARFVGDFSRLETMKKIKGMKTKLAGVLNQHKNSAK